MEGEENEEEEEEGREGNGGERRELKAPAREAAMAGKEGGGRVSQSWGKGKMGRRKKLLASRTVSTRPRVSRQRNRLTGPSHKMGLKYLGPYYIYGYLIWARPIFIATLSCLYCRFTPMKESNLGVILCRSQLAELPPLQVAAAGELRRASSSILFVAGFWPVLCQLQRLMAV